MLQRRLFRHGSSERFLERVLVKFISVEGRFWSEPWEFFQTIFLGGRGKRNFGLYLIRAARVLCYMVQRQFGNLPFGPLDSRKVSGFVAWFRWFLWLWVISRVVLSIGGSDQRFRQQVARDQDFLGVVSMILGLPS